MAGPELAPLWLSLQLATTSTVILILLGLPVAYWLAYSQAGMRPIVDALVTLPLVLPPTVLGFYLLVAFGNQSPLGQFWANLFGSPLVFTFQGLVLGSCIYSLPFMVQPLRTAIAQLDYALLEAAWTLGLSRTATFFHIVLPNIRGSLVTASILSFVHTIGEFGVVLMVGGNIPGRTQVLSIAIYDHVEALEYNTAHLWSGLLLGFSFLVLLLIYSAYRRPSGSLWI